MAIKYPECEKMTAIKDKSQVIGEFIEWLTHERSISIELCVRNDNSDGLMPCHTNVEQLLAEFFGINLEKFEKEQRQILDEIRRKQ